MTDGAARPKPRLVPEAPRTIAGGRPRSVEDLLDDRYLLDALLEHSPDHIYFKDRASRFVRISRSLAAWLGLADPVDAIGLSDADFFAAEHARQTRADEELIVRTGQVIVGIHEREVWPDRRETWVSTTKAPLRDRSGAIIGLLGMSRDITERKLAEDLVAAQAATLAEQAQRLHELATRDDLTGLLNRRGFFDAASHALATAGTGSNQTVMHYLDLDDLKQINDTYGHTTGDRALVAVADALRTLTNASRIAGRVGGDEFCLLETAVADNPFVSGDQLRSALTAAAAAADVPPLSASIGKSSPSTNPELSRLIAQADSDMYARKARRDARPSPRLGWARRGLGQPR